MLDVLMTVTEPVLHAAANLDEETMSLPTGVGVMIKVMVAIFLFGVALETTFDDLARHFRRPWVLLVGVLGQFLLLPAATLLLCQLLQVRGSVALGMLLISCLPAGNLSNLLTHRARGDLGLSIAMTSVSNVVAIAATPVLFAFWAGQYARADALLTKIELDPVEMGVEVGLLIGVPFVLGVVAASRYPAVAARIRKPLDRGVLVLLLLTIGLGVGARAGVILKYVGEVAPAVVLQNLMVLGLGFLLAKAIRLDTGGVRAMTLEMGVRNTALGLVLALAYFDQAGGVALVAALWGLWDVFTGLVLATFWRRRSRVLTGSEPVRS